MAGGVRAPEKNSEKHMRPDKHGMVPKTPTAGTFATATIGRAAVREIADVCTSAATLVAGSNTPPSPAPKPSD